MELDDTLAFIVTELIEGKNLKDDVAANGRYVGDDLERLARKLIEATKSDHLESVKATINNYMIDALAEA